MFNQRIKLPINYHELCALDMILYTAVQYLMEQQHQPGPRNRQQTIYLHLLWQLKQRVSIRIMSTQTVKHFSIPVAQACALHWYYTTVKVVPVMYQAAAAHIVGIIDQRTA